MRTAAIIQARMGSTRLPAKVLLLLAGRPVLEHVVQRVRSSRLVDEVIVATTNRSQDDVIVAECQRLGVTCFRGSEADVLSRYYFAATEAAAETIVRVTSDCPLFDGAILSQMLERFFDAQTSGRKLDYLSNCLQRTFPRASTPKYSHTRPCVRHTSRRRALTSAST